jgi:hypothetical protein
MKITVGELKLHLKSYADDCELYFGGLEFYRLKQRGDKLVQFEFNQTVYKDSQGRVVVENHE